ncbi:hypothetical protein ACIQYL_20220 [Lysinibacillus xylanilyticus]|uniref:hypothetical protein n=1 Tax=Lysinibacillus xylanilyticus TaxID=582475 RepID=UPI003823EAF6
MKSSTTEKLHPGTTLNVCAGCGEEFVVIKEIADVATYCGPECENQHSIFNTNDK